MSERVSAALTTTQLVTQSNAKRIFAPLPELCAASIDRAARCGRHAFAFCLFVWQLPRLRSAR